MQYMIAFYETEAQFKERTDPAKSQAYWGAWGAYIKALYETGKVVSGAGLQPPATATTVRVRKGERLVQDGPYADTKEQLAGFFVMDLPDLDAALGWAARSPAASAASVEVRPVLPPMA
jgi:hypothetical protein